MNQGNRLALFAILIALTFIVQLILINLDNPNTPARAAKNFTKAYHYLDPAMQTYLCTELTTAEVAEDFLYQKKTEADARGLPESYLRYKLFHIHLKTLSQDDTSAQVRLTAFKRVCINTPFMIVATLFQLGDKYPVDAVFDLVNEDGQWRVCGNPFDMKS